MNPEHPENASIALKDGKDYYITAGVEYGQEGFVWTGQAKVTTVLQNLVSSKSLRTWLISAHCAQGTSHRLIPGCVKLDEEVVYWQENIIFSPYIHTIWEEAFRGSLCMCTYTHRAQLKGGPKVW